MKANAKPKKTLVRLLKESILVVNLRKLENKINQLRSKEESLGPRVFRARLRFIKEERKTLVQHARALGYDVE
jgi:hypothetical protein